MSDLYKPKVIILTSRKWNEWVAFDSEIKRVCDPVLMTEKNQLTPETVERINPDYIFVPHWSFIIPKEVYERYTTVIFHMTDLPYGRGGSPLQNLIIRGYNRTKISAILCSPQLDAGDIFCKENLELSGSAIEIFLRASQTIHTMILRIIKEKLQTTPQEGDIVEFKRRKPEESNLQVNSFNSLNQLYDFIRMLDAPDYPKAYLDLDDFRIEFSEVLVKEDGLKGTFEIKKRNKND